MKNNFPIFKKGMNAEDKILLKQLKKERGLLTKSLRGLTNPRRQTTGWNAREIGRAKRTLQSLGYTVPRYVPSADQRIEYGYTLVPNALLDNQYRIDLITQKPVGVEVCIRYIKLKDEEQNAGIRTRKDLINYLLANGDKTRTEINKIIKNRTKNKPYIFRSVFNKQDKSIDFFVERFGATIGYNEGYSIIVEVKVDNIPITKAEYTWDTVPLKDRHAPQLITFDDSNKNITKYINNHNDQCVIDYIYEDYNPKKRNRKTREEIGAEISQLWNENKDKFVKVCNCSHPLLCECNTRPYNAMTDGVSVRQLELWCLAHRITLRVCDEDNRQIYTSAIGNTKSHIPPMMVVVSNGHIYPIVSKKVQQSLANSGRYSQNKRDKNKNVVKTEYKNETSKHYKKIEPTDDLIELADNHTETCFILKDNILENKFLDFIVDRNEMYQHKYASNTMSEIYLKNKNKVVYNEDVDIVMEVCDNLNIPFCNQSLFAILTDILTHLTETPCPLDMFNSTFTTKVFETLKQDFPCGNWVKTYTTDVEYENLEAYDYNKLYSSIIENPNMSWLIFTIFSEIKEYTPDRYIVDNNLYYIDIESPMRLFCYGRGWHIASVVRRGLDKGYITKDNITHIIEGKSVEVDFFQKFIKYLYTNLPENLAKAIINPFIGSLGKTHNTFGKTKWTTSQDHALSKMFQSSREDEFVFSQNYKGKEIYKVYNKKIEERNNILFLLHRQIVQTGWIKVDELIDDLTLPLFSEGKLGGKLFAVKTDCVIVENPNPVITSTERGRYDKENFSRQKFKNTLEQIDRKIHIREKPNFNLSLKSLKEMDIEDEYDTQGIIDKILKHKNVFLAGRAGTGKSYITKGLIEYLEENKIPHKIGAPTHLAKRLLGKKAKTIHQLFGHDIIGKVHSVSFSGKDVMIIDEVSMVSTVFWQELVKLKRKYPDMSFVLCGDFNQLPAVEEEHIDIYNSHYFRDIVDYIFELKHNKRLTENGIKHFNLMTQAINGETLSYNFPKDDGTINKHLCFTNEMRKSINEKMMNKHKPSNAKHIIVKHKPTLRIEKPKSQSMYLYKGLPIMCVKRLNKLELINGDLLIVEEVNDKSVIAKLCYTDETITIPLSNPKEEHDFASNFYPAYALTIHKCQGQTINEKYTLHETNKYSNKMLYVALSRTTDLNLIHIN